MAVVYQEIRSRLWRNYPEKFKSGSPRREELAVLGIKFVVVSKTQKTHARSLMDQLASRTEKLIPEVRVRDINHFSIDS